MKRSDIERQLKNDLQAATPSDFDTLWAKCNAAAPANTRETERVLALATASANKANGGNSHGGFSAGRVRLVAILTAIILALGVFFGAAMGWFGGGKLDKGYFIFDINPSVEVDYDENGKVTSVEGLNEDGKVLLCGVELVGKTYEEAAKALFDGCVKLGYFSAARQDNAVLVSATKEKGGADEEMTMRMKALLADTFTEKKMCGVVITGVDDPTLKDEAQSHGVDAQKYALIYAYLQMGGELCEAEYSQISIRELYKKIAEKEEDLEEAECEELENGIYGTVADKIQEIIEKLEEQIEETQPLSAPVFGGEHGEPQGNDYDMCLNALEEYADELEDARNEGEFKSFLSRLLSTLDEMIRQEKNNVLRDLFKDAHTQINEVLENYDIKISELKKLGASAEDQHAAREEKFGKDHGENTFDWEEWLDEYEDKEDDFEQSWYSRKNQWDEDRKKDLDD